MASIVPRWLEAKRLWEEGKVMWPKEQQTNDDSPVVGIAMSGALAGHVLTMKDLQHNPQDFIAKGTIMVSLDGGRTVRPANVAYEQTELGQWCAKALETMLGCGPWTFDASLIDSGGSHAICAGHSRIYLLSKHVLDGDPVKLMGALVCSACGVPIWDKPHANRYQHHDWGAYPRSICESCCLGRNADQNYRGIAERDARLGISPPPPRAKMWQIGGHGVRLECAKSKTGFKIDLNIKPNYTAESFKNIAENIDKQVAAIIAASQQVSVNSLAEQYSVPMVKEPETLGCDWCSAGWPARADTIVRNHCTDLGCKELERLYRERLSAGGVDCPEEREAVRRFARRNEWHSGFTRGDIDRDIGRYPRDERGRSLDQRIAAAQVKQEVKRHPSDWEVFSGASYED